MKSAVFRRNREGIRERDISYYERTESVGQMIRRQFKSTPLARCGIQPATLTVQ